MSKTYEVLIDQMLVTLHETNAKRWTRTELLNYLHLAELQVVGDRPDALSVTNPVVLVQGTKQSIPAEGLRLIKVIRNDTPSSKRFIELTSEDVLNNANPNWHDETVLANMVDSYVYDELTPRDFYVEPAVNAGVQILISYSTAPTLPTAETDTIQVPHSYVNAMIDFALYRAYSKDAEYAANDPRMQVHYQAYLRAMGIKTEVDMATTPNNKGGK